MAKTFMQDGKWTDNPNQPAVVHCACGNKYIKTREGQVKCLRCMHKGRSA
jgi:hypothetical protein